MLIKNVIYLYESTNSCQNGLTHLDTNSESNQFGSFAC